MFRWALRLIVALVTFCLGITAVIQVTYYRMPPVEASEEILCSKPGPIDLQPLTFTRTLRACGELSWSQGYAASDGEMLFESGQVYDSSAHADKEMRKLLKDAEEVIERAPKLDETGQQVGERIVAVFPPDEFGKEWVRIIWTDEAVLRSINAPSLRHALALEKTENR